MPLKCFNCSSKSGGPNKLHVAPNTAEYRHIWLKVIPNMLITDLNKNFRMCSLHFDQKYFTSVGRLARNAVPSKFLFTNGMWNSIDMTESSNVLNDIQNVSEPAIEIEMDEITTNNFGITPSTESIKIEVLPIASISTMDILPIKQQKLEYVPPQTPTFQGFEITSTSGVVSQNFRYAEDINSDVVYTPRTTKRALKKISDELTKIKKVNKNLNKKIKRLEGKLNELENFLDNLEENRIISSDSREKLNALFIC